MIFSIWISFIPIAIINSLLREKFLVPFLGMSLALPLSGIFCALFFFILAYFSLPWIGPLTLHQSDAKQAIAVFQRQIILISISPYILFSILYFSAKTVYISCRYNIYQPEGEDLCCV